MHGVLLCVQLPHSSVHIRVKGEKLNRNRAEQSLIARFTAGLVCGIVMPQYTHSKAYLSQVATKTLQGTYSTLTQTQSK